MNYASGHPHSASGHRHSWSRNTAQHAGDTCNIDGTSCDSKDHVMSIRRNAVDLLKQLEAGFHGAHPQDFALRDRSNTIMNSTKIIVRNGASDVLSDWLDSIENKAFLEHLQQQQRKQVALASATVETELSSELDSNTGTVSDISHSACDGISEAVVAMPLTDAVNQALESVRHSFLRVATSADNASACESNSVTVTCDESETKSPGKRPKCSPLKGAISKGAVVRGLDASRPRAEEDAIRSSSTTAQAVVAGISSCVGEPTTT